MKFIPLRSQNPSNPDPSKNLLNGPSVRNCLNDKISFGFPSVPRMCHFGDIWATRGKLDVGGTEAAGSSAQQGLVNERKTMTFNEVI